MVNFVVKNENEYDIFKISRPTVGHNDDTSARTDNDNENLSRPTQFALPKYIDCCFCISCLVRHLYYES